MKRKVPFSMMEVIVVFAVIATTMSILFSSIQTSKDVAMKATCMSNISQIRNYAELYRKDYNNLPYTEIWLTDFTWVEPYTSKDALGVFSCPGDDGAQDLKEFNQLRYNTSYYYVPSSSQLEKNIVDGQAFGVSDLNIPDLAASQDAVIYDKSPEHHNGSINIAYLFKSDDPDFDGEANEGGTITSLNSNPSDTDNDLLAVLDDGTVEVPDLADDPVEVAEEVAEEVADETVDFTIDEGVLVLEENASAAYKILGTAISYGGQYDMPVTTKIRFQEPDGNVTVVQPFGNYGSPTSGGVSAGQSYSPGTVYEAGTELTVIAKSWYKRSSRYSGSRDSHWRKYLEIDSNSSRNVKVLRDGDEVPQISGFLNQGSVVSFLGGYIANNKINLEANQAIFLFELGTTNLSSSAADFQDCVVVVTLFPEAN